MSVSDMCKRALAILFVVALNVSGYGAMTELSMDEK